MLLPASQEYIALCQSHVELLRTGLQASEIAIYLTEQLDMSGDASLKPLVVFPETAQGWQSIQKQLEGAANSFGPLMLAPSKDKPQTAERSEGLQSNESLIETQVQSIQPKPQELKPDRFQLIFPLKHDNAVLGILMIARTNTPWSEQDKLHGEQVATSLSLACVLDQRSQWLSQANYEKQALFEQEHQRLGNLLHQFRNPLTALRTLGKLMVKRMTPQDPNQKFAQSIVTQSDRLEMMLGEFSQTISLGEKTVESLEYEGVNLMPSPSQPLLPSAGVISGGKLTLQACWVTEILSQIITAARGRLEEKEMKIETKFLSEYPPVYGDISALYEVFSNLIDNAIKYTPPGGLITIRMSSPQTTEGQQSYQEIAISDTGYGIPNQDLENIFTTKYRGIQSHSDIPGTGLGLAIVRDLIQKMGGSIYALSPSELQRQGRSQTTNKETPGSTFIVTLPLKENS